MDAQGPALYVFAHNDDELSAFLRLREDVRQGREVHVAWLTESLFRARPGERPRESTRAMALLGVPAERLHFLGASLGVTGNGTLLVRIADVIERLTALVHELAPGTIATTAIAAGRSPSSGRCPAPGRTRAIGWGSPSSSCSGGSCAATPRRHRSSGPRAAGRAVPGLAGAELPRAPTRRSPALRARARLASPRTARQVGRAAARLAAAIPLRGFSPDHGRPRGSARTEPGVTPTCAATAP